MSRKIDTLDLRSVTLARLARNEITVPELRDISNSTPTPPTVEETSPAGQVGLLGYLTGIPFFLKNHL